MKAVGSKRRPSIFGLFMSGKRKNWESLWYSLLAIGFSFLLVALIMLTMGYNPIRAYIALFKGAFGSIYALSLTLSRSVPLIFVGLAVGFALKGGMFNIGGEGQLYVGGLTSAAVALALPAGMPVFLSLPTSILAGMVAGMIWGGVIGLIKAKLQINEVIVAIMLNYIAQFLTSYFVNGPLMAEGSMSPQTEILPAGMQLPSIIPNSQLTTSLYIALFMALVYWFVLRHTVFGYEVKALGDNPNAASTGGVPTVWTTVLVMAFSGAMASLAGIFEVFGTHGRFIDGFSSGLGFTGIAIAFIGQGKPIGIILAAILFGSLQAGSMQMSLMEGVSANIDKVIQGLVIVFIATPNIIRYMVSRKER